ncbi:hypothetical protein FSARC_7855 [Fusarium sarcochroum]|uniref:F-box domain-containing protein n=1 Tax=Fusarium sarcochroum TaxID=1208366 RepID=A0A8H4TU61_9HYPO|nr:hypothetical protein FSARC_7855 [Fusarium sarcochroum]
MADPNTTATLARMPTEILCMVKPHLGDADLSSITRVSKRLRRMFLPLHFRDVLLRGNMAQLSLRLASFLDEQSVSIPGPICQYVEIVHFRITGTDESDQTAVCLATEKTIELIGDFFRKAPGLRHAAFNFWTVNNDPQKAQFTRLLGNTDQWSGPRSVYLHDIDLDTTRAIIHHCVPEALEAVRITSRYGSDEYNVLKSHCPTLKRLYVADPGRRSHGNTARLVVPSMDHSVVDAINADFSQLEWLVIKEGGLRRSSHIRRPGSQSREHLNHLDQIIETLIESLRAMPHLTRFACTLARQELHNCLIRQDWSRAGGRGLTEAELDAWYSALILRISNSVPRLEQLCIESHLCVSYRGTKTPGQTDMEIRREESDEAGQRYRFPLMLVD